MTEAIYRAEPVRLYAVAHNAARLAEGEALIRSPFASLGTTHGDHWSLHDKIKQTYAEVIEGTSLEENFNTALDRLAAAVVANQDYRVSFAGDELVINAQNDDYVSGESTQFYTDAHQMIWATSPEGLAELLNADERYNYATWRIENGELVPTATDTRGMYYFRANEVRHEVTSQYADPESYTLIRDGKIILEPFQVWASTRWGSMRPALRVNHESNVATYIRERLRGLGRGQIAEPALPSRWELRDGRAQRDTQDAFDRYRNSTPTFGQTNVFEGMRILPTSSRASRRWGIEVETGAGAGIATPPGWDDREDGSLVSAYGASYIEPSECPEYADNHESEIYVERVDNGDRIYVDNPNYADPDYCDYCGDRDGYSDYENCREFVSPILTSVHSRGLKDITSVLEDRPVSDSAGIHVHVEASDLTPAQVANLLMAYDKIEPIIEASYQRDERGYCKRRSTSEMLSVLRNYKQNPNKSPRDLYYGDRYVTVNLMALGSHGTIEFRAMGPVYNYNLLVRWATFCREMVNLAKAQVPLREWNKVKDFAGIEALFEKYGQEYPKAAEVVAQATTPAESDLALVG